MGRNRGEGNSMFAIKQNLNHHRREISSFSYRAQVVPSLLFVFFPHTTQSVGWGETLHSPDKINKQQHNATPHASVKFPVTQILQLWNFSMLFVLVFIFCCSLSLSLAQIAFRQVMSVHFSTTEPVCRHHTRGKRDGCDGGVWHSLLHLFKN